VVADGAELAVGGDRGLLELWDVSGAPHLVRSRMVAEFGGALRIALAPGGEAD
jgi:hypothetical protein